MTESTNALRCLVVEDDFIITAYLETMVTRWGYDVCGHAPTAGEAIDLARELEPDVILMDIRLAGGRDGVSAAAAIRRFAKAHIVFITASREDAMMRRLRPRDRASIVFKPIDPEQLRSAMCA